jgi:hypothetical protein
VASHCALHSCQQIPKTKRKTRNQKEKKNKTLNDNDNVQGTAADGYCACADTERAKKKVRRDGFRNAHITDSRSTGSSNMGVPEGEGSAIES